MLPHIQYIMRTCYYQLLQLRSVRRALPIEVAGSMIRSLICPRVDYCNSSYFGASATNIRRLQSVLNSAARFICRRSKFDHVTDVIRDELHWLPIRQRIEFKICLQTYKCLQNAAPSYLTRYSQPISTDAGRWHPCDELQKVTWSFNIPSQHPVLGASQLRVRSSGTSYQARFVTGCYLWLNLKLIWRLSYFKKICKLTNEYAAYASAWWIAISV